MNDENPLEGIGGRIMWGVRGKFKFAVILVGFVSGFAQ
jgi:hypothetical protein